MNEAKHQILQKIRRALGENTRAPEAEYDMIPRNYVAIGTMDAANRLSLFLDRLEDYGAVVYRCSVETIRQTVRDAMRARAKQALVVPIGVREAWLPEDHSFIHDHDLTYDDLDRSEGVLTGCALAIASTGTIVLAHSPAEGRRALSLVPDYHLCVVYEDQVVETVAEGIRRMHRFHSAPITTIAGPSATSDIEMTRVKGVHGPRVLDIILAAT